MAVPTTEYSFDQEVPQHAPELYDYRAVAQTIDSFESITEADLTDYREQGFIAVENAFTRQEIDDALAGLDDLIAGKIPEYKAIQFRADARERLNQLSFEERLDAVRRLLSFTEYESRLKAMALHPGLLKVVFNLLGAEPELFQSMALIKPPRGREKPWHQDHAYFELEPQTPVVGVWIALDPAGIENGCMRVLPKWRRRGVITHFQIRDWQIRDEEMEGLQDQRIAVPLSPGGCLIFDSYLPHGTPSNFTETRRRAVQFHYCPKGSPRITNEERLAVFSQKDYSGFQFRASCQKPERQ
jgi:ectoine hydroxylase-related dioxygenase (phytanoyl-CoA dioxygenase family)